MLRENVAVLVEVRAAKRARVGRRECGFILTGTSIIYTLNCGSDIRENECKCSKSEKADVVEEVVSG